MKFDGSVYWCVDKYVGDGVVRGIDDEVENSVGNEIGKLF